MSYDLIRAALEAALTAMSPALPTAWENAPFTPTAIAYQRANMLPAPAANPAYDNTTLETGIMQVTLVYPEGVGAKDAVARAGLLRTTFARGASFISGSVKVTITRTPTIAPALFESGRYVLPVSIPYFAYI